MLYPPSLIRLLFTVVSEAVRRVRRLVRSVGQFVAVGCVRVAFARCVRCVDSDSARKKGRRGV